MSFFLNLYVSLSFAVNFPSIYDTSHIELRLDVSARYSAIVRAEGMLRTAKKSCFASLGLLFLSVFALLSSLMIVAVLSDSLSPFSLVGLKFVAWASFTIGACLSHDVVMALRTYRERLFQLREAKRSLVAPSIEAVMPKQLPAPSAHRQSLLPKPIQRLDHGWGVNWQKQAA